MNIVLASDNNYAAHMATLIVSLCENNDKTKKISIHILSNELEENIKNKILKLEQKYLNLNIHYYDLSSKEIEKRIGLKIKHDRSISAYARIFIPEILSPEINKALYLDVDGIVLESIEEIFDIDISNYYIAGVSDVVRKQKKIGIDLKEDETYINSGMILWNLKKCREEKVVNKFISFIKIKNGDVLAMDQGTINGAISPYIKILDPKWNVLTPFFQLSNSEILKEYGMTSYYGDIKLNDAISRPKFIHFVPNHMNRPWKKGCLHPLKKEYWKYRNETMFKSHKLEKDDRKNKEKILGGLFYLLPYNLYKFFFEKYSKFKMGPKS